MSVGMKGENLHVEAETEAVPEITYTAELSATKTSESSSNSQTEKEAATGPFKRCLSGIAVVLALVLIILIVLKWQKQRKQDP